MSEDDTHSGSVSGLSGSSEPHANVENTDPRRLDAAPDENDLAEKPHHHLAIQETYELSHVQTIADAARAFEDLSPGRGEALMDAFLEDYRAQTRRADEEHRVQRNGFYLGYIMAALIAVLLIGGAIYSISVGSEIGAGAFLAAAAVSMVTSFLDASTRRRRADPDE